MPSIVITIQTIKFQYLCLALFSLLVELCPVMEKIISFPRLETHLFLLLMITLSSFHPTLVLPLFHS